MQRERESSGGEFQCFLTVWCYQQTVCLIWLWAIMEPEWMPGWRGKDKRGRNGQQIIGHVSFLPEKNLDEWLWCLFTFFALFPSASFFLLLPFLLNQGTELSVSIIYLSPASSASSAALPKPLLIYNSYLASSDTFLIKCLTSPGSGFIS